jgi:hypothetical protein
MGAKFRKELVVMLDDTWRPVEKYRHSDSAERMTAYGPYHDADRCFYCGDYLSGEAVLYWSGFSADPRHPQRKGHADLHLHPGCFIEITTRLFSDFHRIEFVTNHHQLKNASARPPYPANRSDEGWAIWRKLWDKMRDLTVVQQ